MAPKARLKPGVRLFFARSDLVDHEVLRPLDHIRPNWELTWNAETNSYSDEEESFAGLFNKLIDELARTTPPRRYHDHEDRLAEFVKRDLNWNVRKVGRRWVGADYESILEQGGFDDVDQVELLLAAAGRVKAAMDRGQTHYDDMESSHRRMLGGVLAVILYHRSEL